MKNNKNWSKSKNKKTWSWPLPATAETFSRWPLRRVLAGSVESRPPLRSKTLARSSQGSCWSSARSTRSWRTSRCRKAPSVAASSSGPSGSTWGRWSARRPIRASVVSARSRLRVPVEKSLLGTFSSGRRSGWFSNPRLDTEVKVKASESDGTTPEVRWKTWKWTRVADVKFKPRVIKKDLWCNTNNSGGPTFGRSTYYATTRDGWSRDSNPCQQNQGFSRGPSPMYSFGPMWLQVS